MKYIIIPYIALGFVLSSAIGINYHCTGSETFPEFYGSPFVFKRQSLGSSMTYFYSVSGVLLNVGVWSILILLIRKPIHSLLERIQNKKLGRNLFKGLIVVLIVFTTVNILFDYLMLGRGFEPGSNYWYMNLDKEANDWGMTCEGEWTLFGK
jgi:hypothetical protein